MTGAVPDLVGRVASAQGAPSVSRWKLDYAILLKRFDEQVS